MSKDRFYTTRLQEEHLDQAADVLTRSFLELNSIWKNNLPSYEHIMPIMRGKILPTLAPNAVGGCSYVLMKGRDVVGVSLQYEMLEFMKMPSMPSNIELFSKLGEAGKRLESSIDLTEVKRGEAIYGLYGVIDPNYAKMGLSLDFWWFCFAAGKANWKYYYSRISSPISLKMLQKLGAEVVAETDLELDDGQTEKLWMVRLPMGNTAPLSALRALSKRPKTEPAETARL